MNAAVTKREIHLYAEYKLISDIKEYVTVLKLDLSWWVQNVTTDGCSIMALKCSQKLD